MRALSSTAAVLTGLMALTTALPAQAQGKPAAPAKPAAAPAKPAAAPAKPAATPAKPAAAPAAGTKIVPRAGGTATAKAGVTATAKTPAAPKPLTDKQKKDLAKKNYKEGEASFKDGKYAEALEHYRVAEDAVPIGATKYKIAASLDKLGKVQESVAAYQVFLDSTPDAVKMKDAIADSTARVEALKKTPGKVRVATEPSSPPNLKFAIDAAAPVPGIAVPAPVALAPATPAPAAPGAAPAAPGAAPAAPGADAAPAMAFNGEFSVAPGHHKITATADGYDPTSAEVDVSFAETKDVKLALNLTPPPPPPPVVAPPPPVAVEPPPQPILPPPAKRSNVPAYVTLGLAGAGAIVGTIFGISALGSKSDFNAPGGATVENADKTDRNALIADMSFAVALTFGVTGAVLLLSNDTPTETKAATNGAPGPRKPVKSAMPRGFVAPYAGPTGGGAAAFMTF